MTPRLPIRSALAAVLVVSAAAATLARAQALPVQRAAQPPRDARPATETGTAAIRGRIVDADSARPLRRVQIRLTSAALSQPRTTSSDSDGQYEITDLPAGRYTLTATRSGYLTLGYGQRRPLEQGKPLTVAEGQTLERVDFALPRMGVIAGRITDETGDPIANVTVLAMRSMFFDGRRQLIPTGDTPGRTDDTGEFRITGLVPGTYVVSAQTQDKWIVEENGREETMGYAPTYLPGTTHVEEAARLMLGIGKEIENTGFSLSPGRAARVSGTAVDSHGRPFQSVNLGQEIRGQNFGSFRGGGSATVAADGTFTIADVAPGDYTLQASRREPPAEVAILPLVVDSVDITNASLTGSTGGSISGRIVAAPQPPKLPVVRIRVQKRLMGQGAPLLLDVVPSSGVAQVKDDGTFTIENVFGPARFDVSVPDGWVVKAVTHQGRDLADTVIDPKSGDELSEVLVLITDRIATLSGDLTNQDGAPVADGTVIVFAAEPARWFEGSRFVRAERPDQKGRYQVKGLLPGTYLVAAVDYVEEGGWNDPEYLESLRPRARSVTIAEGESQTLPMTIGSP